MEAATGRRGRGQLDDTDRGVRDQQADGAFLDLIVFISQGAAIRHVTEKDLHVSCAVESLIVNALDREVAAQLEERGNLDAGIQNGEADDVSFCGGKLDVDILGADADSLVYGSTCVVDFEDDITPCRGARNLDVGREPQHTGSAFRREDEATEAIGECYTLNAGVDIGCPDTNCLDRRLTARPVGITECDLLERKVAVKRESGRSVRIADRNGDVDRPGKPQEWAGREIEDDTFAFFVDYRVAVIIDPVAIKDEFLVDVLRGGVDLELQFACNVNAPEFENQVAEREAGGHSLVGDEDQTLGNTQVEYRISGIAKLEAEPGQRDLDGFGAVIPEGLLEGNPGG